MKKMLILALIALFYIGASVMTPPQMTVVDDDVDIGYVASMDQTADVVAYIADNDYLPCSDSRSPVSLDVEKSSYTITLNSQIDVLCFYDSHYSTPANQMTNPQGSNSMNRELGGLITGNVSPWDGVKSRHI